jgi:amino acid permease
VLRSSHDGIIDAATKLQWIPVSRQRLKSLYKTALSVAVIPTASRLERIGVMSRDSYSSLGNLANLPIPSLAPQGRMDPSSEEEQGISKMQVALMIANVLVGAGLLGLPFAFRLAGGALGALVVLCATAVTAVTAQLIIWSLEDLCVDPDKLSYMALAEAVAGTAGSLALQIVTLVECYGAVVCFIVLHTVNWPIVLSLPPVTALTVAQSVHEVPTSTVVVVPICCAAFVITLVRPRHLAYLSGIGLLATACLLATVVVAALDQDLAHEGDVCPSLSHGAAVSDSSAAPSSSRVMSHAMFIPEGLGASLGVVLFCFSGHATFPDLYAQMKPSDRPHFGTSVIMGFSFAGAFYGFTSPLPRSATWHMARKSGSNPQHL